ncbi:MAG: metallophosphoesterase [Bacteroidales bacterium]|nr:metallophosphoesterase [Bacteroidales bacterium]
MKTVSIGDTHGMAVVDAVLKMINKYDKFIFAGDYVDAFDVDNTTMKKNLLDIIELKKKYPEKIILLWGNHDIHYLLGNKYYCSGYRPEMKHDFNEIFNSNENLFQLAFQSEDWLWTHAGISTGWFESRFKPFAGGHNNTLSISELLNLAFDNRYPALFDVGYERGGDRKFGGPLWCDITELGYDPLKGFNQIVGHNPQEHIISIKRHDKEVAFIDILQRKDKVDPSCFYYKEID